MMGAEEELGDRVHNHRCLQHTKTDIRAAAFKKDDDTGTVRLSRPEFLPVIIEWVEFSAWLCSDHEFDCFWDTILTRMGDPKDWNEPLMAKYLSKHILDTSGPLIRASWACGFGCVPLGFTTYAPNCIERCHRTVKGLLPGSYKTRDLSRTMV